VKNLLLAGIALVALAAPAAAADMPLKAPAPVAIDIWTGGYVGANVGYDWGSDVVNSVGTPGQCSSGAAGCVGAGAVPPNVYSILSAQAATFNTSLRHSGFIYGGQAGHNWLVHNMFWTNDGVLGVEVDFQGKSDSHSATLTGMTAAPFPGQPIIATTTLNEKIDSLGTLRGRAGLLWGPNTLVYATAGVAWASATSSGFYGQNVPIGAGPATIAPYGNGSSVKSELFGAVVGGGIEWKWTANWSVKAEYLYADLGSLTYNTQIVNPIFPNAGSLSSATVNVNTHVRDNIARVGVNYRFW
jgi:outer membrane immunogenic protein